MAIAGRVAIVPKGDWSADATYKRLDAVTYNNTLYFAKKNVPAGTVTSNTEYWSKSIVGGAGAIATTEEAGIVKPDGTTITVDEDGTLHGSSSVDEMTGATADADGTSGTVPAPKAGQENHVLKGNGAWEALTYDSELSAESENAPQTKVVDAKTKKIEENLSQLSNPNLLINPDFRINQRDGKIVESGKNYYSDESCETLVSTTTSAYTATKISNGNYSISIDSTAYYVSASDVVDGYCEPNGNRSPHSIDRWQIVGCKLTIFSDRINVANAIGQHNSYIQTKIELSKKIYQDSIFTYTVSTSRGIISVIGKIGTINLKNDVIIGSNWENDEVSRFYIQNANNTLDNGFDIKWAKLELGSVATPFVPPDPASELVKCQRYYQKSNNSLTIFHTQNNTVDHSFILPTPLRINNPTCHVYSGITGQEGKLAALQGATFITDFSVDIYVCSDNFRVVTGTPVTNLGNALFNYTIDAEIY